MKLVVLIAILISLLTLPVFAIDYVITDLGFGGACGINDLGQITGWRPDQSGGSRGFVWSKESGFINIDSSRGQAINNLGQVISGRWLWDQVNGWSELSSPADEVTTSAINSNGQVAGSDRYYTGGYDAVMWNRPSEHVGLGIPSTWSSWSYDINEAGTVVGEMTSGPTFNHAFMWNKSSGLIDLGSFNTSFARADGINDLGQIVGQYNPNDYRHAFLWSQAGGLIDIGTLSGGHHSQAIRINNNGLVVGWSMYIAGNPARHPFVWDQATGIVDLGTGLGECGVGDINNRNQIVGYFLDTQGESHIALWEPVPEPSSMLALGAGIATITTLKRRKRG